MTSDLLLLLLAAAFAASASETPVPKAATDQGVRPAEWSELRSGEVVTRIDQTREGIGSAAVGYVVVRAPWTRAFEIVADRERMTEYSTCLKSLVVLSREGAGGVERTKARETHQTMRIRRRYTVDYEDPQDSPQERV